jgi:hypothetical protein
MEDHSPPRAVRAAVHEDHAEPDDSWAELRRIEPSDLIPGATTWDDVGATLQSWGATISAWAEQARAEQHRADMKAVAERLAAQQRARSRGRLPVRRRRAARARGHAVSRRRGCSGDDDAGGEPGSSERLEGGR